MKVQRGYISTGQAMSRTLVDSRGRVYLDHKWQHFAGEVVTEPGVYERWVDVPETWLGFRPYWSSGCTRPPLRQEVIYRVVTL